MRSPFRGFFRKSFLERNQRVIGALGILAIIAGSGVALLLSGGVFARTYPVAAHFTDAGGIETGDKVTVAGLDAGTVKGLHIQQGQVVIDLAVNRGVELPEDSRAEIVIQTLLGRRSVNLVAGQDRSRTLEQVGVIPVERSTTPIDITDLNDISVRLLNGSDAGALNQLLREVTTITQGKRDQVHELVSGLSKVLAAVDSRKSQLAGLITALRTLSTTLGERDTTIVSLIDNLNPVLSNLAAHQQDLRDLLVATDSASHESASLVERNRSVLDATLASLHDDLQVLDDHQLDLAATISYLNQSLQGYASVGSAGCQPQPTTCTPVPWANIFVQSLGAAGVDAIVGPCGAVDQLIDQILGTSCTDSAKAPQPGAKTPGTGSPKPPVTPSLPGLPQPLPGNVGDLVRSALQGTGAGS